MKVGSVAFLKSAGSGFGIGLSDDGRLIEFLDDWRTLESLTVPLANRQPVYLEVEDWAIVAIDEDPRIPLTREGMAERARFVRSALAAMDEAPSGGG